MSNDAAIIAADFAIDPERVQPLMCKGLIKSLCERGLIGAKEQLAAERRPPARVRPLLEDPRGPDE